MAENEQEQAPVPEAPEPKKSKKWLLIVGGLLVFAAGIPAGLYFSGFFAPEEVAASEVPEEVELEVNQLVDFDPFVVNLAGSSHYLRLGMSLGVSNESGTPLFQEGDYLFPKVKDLLLQIIGEKTTDELLEPSSKETLKEEIRTRFNEVLLDHEAQVLEVYFTDFIVQ